MGKSNVAVSPGCPDAIAGLDLSKPALLEASAGTGKTYAIEHLVLRLLIESETLGLPDILVLTFTEKATGELKEKIRARIAWRIALGGLPPSILERLKLAHAHFDRASIFTIHGFCQKVLRKYAFENNALFRQELVKNVPEVIEQVLYEEMRSTWLSQAGTGPDGLDAFRKTMGALGLGPASKWDKRLIGIAKDFHPLRGDVLLPAYDPGRVASLEGEIAAAFAAIGGLFPEPAPGKAADHPFALRYREVRFASKATKSKGPKILELALQTAAACRPPPTAPGAGDAKALALGFMDGVSAIGLAGVDKQGFSFLMPKPEECPDLPWPELDSLLALLEKVRLAVVRIEKEKAALAFADPIRVITELRSKTQAHLRSLGQITYDGMIEDVCMALREKQERVRMLRQDYRFCLVDEFQDTDPLQWEIFRRIFLDGGSAHPLYLIGDPKQAIYRFRGGDVHTYMEARKAMFALSREGKAQGLGLDTNFRSSRAMVDACNAAFAHAGWFHSLAVDPGDLAWRLPAEPDPLGYLPVKHGGLRI